MSEWREATLTTLGSFERGRSRHRPRNDPALFGEAMPFFQTGDVKAAVLHMTGASDYYSDFGVNQSRVWEPGIACITIAANIAETAVLGEPACFPDSIVGFTPCDSELDAYYVKYLLDFHKAHLTSAARGTTQDNLSLEKLLAHRFMIPDAHTRQRIVSVLRSVDDLIENNLRRIDVSEGMAQAIYREWFVHFRYPGHEDATFVDSNLGPIPSGWEVGRLRDVATEVRRSIKRSPETAAMAYVPIDSISPKSLTLRESKPGEEAASSLRLFEEGDVLFGAMRAYFHKVCVAPFAGVTRSTCFVLTPDPSRPVFAAHALSQVETVDYAAAHSTGSTIPYAKWDGVLSEMPIVLPPTELSKEFDEIAEPLLAMAQSLVPQIDRLSEIRDFLLPKLVTGAIDVSALDLDALVEAAS